MRGGRSGSSVVKLLHRTHANTPTRCDLMMAEPSEDWNVFKQIFADHWDEFKHAHPRYQTAYYEGLVAKMLGCGNSEQMGYVACRCLQCGQGTHRVAMSCKSSLCLRCAKVYVDNWVSQVSKVLHEGVIYRHIILTVPAMFRTTFYHNAAVVLSAFMRCGVQCMDDFFSEVRGKALRGGYIVVLHTHGRNGQYHPHLHLIATSGGYDGQGQRWEHLHDLPYELLRRNWQWQLLALAATKAFCQVKGLIHEGLGKVGGVGKGAIKIIARLAYRQRYEQSTGRDPLICPHCRGEMGVWRIWHPTYGVIYDEGEVIKRGTYASTAPRASP